MRYFIRYILYVLLTLLSFTKLTFAQNLVRNPSFEEFYSCPTTGLLDGFLKEWDVLYQNNASYFNSCSGTTWSVPNQSGGYQLAHTGNAYCYIRVYYYDQSYTAIGEEDSRSYLENQLINYLQKDSIYCISYFVSLQDNGDYGTPGPNGAIQNVDAYLSDTVVDWNNGFGRRISGINPQIKSKQLLEDTENWMLVSDLYKAKGGEQYIIIGNFLHSNNTTKVYYKPDMQVNYYIDDVSVTMFNIAPPNLGNDTILCANTPLTLTAPIGYDEYVWSNGTTNNTLAIADSGTYWVKCIANGCGEITDTIHVGYYNIPALNLPNDTTLCLGNSINLSAQQGFNTYTWSTGATTANITVVDSGLFILEATSFCGTQTDSVYIALDSLPTYTFSIGNDTTVCHDGKNVSLILFADTVLPNYFWNTGATTDSLVINTEGQFQLTTRYFCGNINSNVIHIEQCPEDSLINVYFPNSFTPNNDGINDLFMPYFTNIEPIIFQVFNVWGIVVYQSKTDFFWDGTFNNIPCPTGLYVYRFSYKFREILEHEDAGKFSLLRE
ncbi:MAG: gliding motility-associated C-terminal domain-containing protein [Flavobacteriales bacterium]|nr:gliding motility-associated C-terminal domain-containing protein [Flavobacteriales bacterium]